MDATSKRSIDEKVKEAIAAYLAKPDTTDRDEEYLGWVLNELRAGRDVKNHMLVG